MRPTHNKTPVVAPAIFGTADEALRHRDAVGPLPVLTDQRTWNAAWVREIDRLTTDHSKTHDAFRNIYPARPSCPSATRINAKPEAWVPTLDDRATSISVVRRRHEVVYRRSYVGLMDDDDVDAPMTQSMD